MRVYIIHIKRTKIKIIFSEAGGIDIEELAATQPEKIVMENIDYFPSLNPFLLRQILFGTETIDAKYLNDISSGRMSVNFILWLRNNFKRG